VKERIGINTEDTESTEFTEKRRKYGNKKKWEKEVGKEVAMRKRRGHEDELDLRANRGAA
jgi:hypothetical protein